MLRPAVAATNWASAGISGLDMRGGGLGFGFAIPAGISAPKCLPGQRPSTTGAGRLQCRGADARWAGPLPEMRRLVVAGAAAKKQQHHQADADNDGESRP